CLNPLCTYFMFAQGRSDAPTATSQQSSQGTFTQTWQQSSQGPSAQGPSAQAPQQQQHSTGPSRPINIQYVNFQGQQKTFTADASTLKRSKEHILAKVAPKGQQIALARRRIQNLSEVEQALPAGHRGASGEHYPNARERQVLSYHKKHKSTSPLYEKIRAKYPDW
ncbi:MAG TPA: hypothetical protein VG759_08270, partial [Candidatus Angelobacter sp.]|nr:hypothetical protein [Candidatus Angelobacter sp.]